jgi:hypothetical protein
MIKRYSNSKLVEDFTNFPKNGFWGATVIVPNLGGGSISMTNASRLDDAVCKPLKYSLKH